MRRLSVGFLGLLLFPFIVAAQDSTDRAYTAWGLRGTKGFLSMSWIGLDKRYLLQLYTIRDSDPPILTRVHALRIPSPPPGYRMTNNCAARDSVPNGQLVATVRKLGGQDSVEILRAWRVDIGKLRIVAVPTRAITCRVSPLWEYSHVPPNKRLKLPGAHK